MNTPDATLARAIIAAVAEHHGLTVAQVMSRDRSHDLARARHIAMWRIRHQLGWSYQRIGRQFNMSHWAAFHGVRRIAQDHKHTIRLDQMKRYAAIHGGDDARVGD